MLHQYIFFCLFSLADIPDGAFMVEHCPGFVTNNPTIRRDPGDGPILAVHFELEVADTAFLVKQGDIFAASFRLHVNLVNVHDVGHKVFQCIVAVDTGKGRIHAQASAVRGGSWRTPSRTE